MQSVMPIPQESLRIEACVYFRQKRLYAISRYIHLHQAVKIKSSEDLVYDFLSKNKPIYLKRFLRRKFILRK